MGYRAILRIGPGRTARESGSCSTSYITLVDGIPMLTKGPDSRLAIDTFYGYEIGLLKE